MNAESSSAAQSNELIAYFITRPDEFAWTSDVCEHIVARRAAMSGQLFFDILLELGGVDKPAALYPPTSLLGLKRLLDAIQSASYDTMKRDCLIYYLLKQSIDGREVSYVSEKVISQHYVSLADAYWELDFGINLQSAIAKISDARIVKEYTTKILDTLGLEKDSANLIRKFVRTCRPALRELSDMECYIIATAEYSIVEAWKYQRTFPTVFPGRKTLLRRLLEWALTPKPKPQSLTQLLALPFSRYEESVLQDFAVHPPETLPPPSIQVVRDLVCVRLIQSCKYAAAVRFDRQYPSSGAAPRGTWGAERDRIVKEVLSIMPAVERDSIENELAALGADARMRSSSGTSASARPPWPSSNPGASGSTDLGSSWEDVGHRTSAGPRRSFGGRPRTSIPNGTAAKPTVSSPGASASSARSAQPLSAQSTFVSQDGTAPNSANSSSRPFSPVVNAAESPASAARLFARKATAPVPAPVPKANGTPNGTPTINSSNFRNAFFVPAQSPRTPSPALSESRRSSGAPSPTPRRTQAQPEARLPTPPSEEPEKAQEDRTGKEQMHKEISSSASANRDEGHSPESEREDLRSSIFGTTVPVPAPATRLTPSSGSISPNNRRKFQDEETGSQRKKLRVSVPGAFVTDDDNEHDHDHDLPSPTSATIEKPHARAPNAASRRTPSRTMPTRRSARKRSASPEDDGDDDVHLSMPGSLFDEDANRTVNGSNGRTNVPLAQQNGREDSEEADELGPLPTSRSRRKTDPTSALASSSAMRTPRRGTRSLRSNSTEPEERHVSQSTGRPVRRSSRLQSVEISPTAEQANKAEVKKERKEARPKKSKRTTGAGATATGHSASKRR